jgi:hypothetical protein
MQTMSSLGMFLVLILTALQAAVPVMAQQVTGVPGSSSAGAQESTQHR